MRRTTSDGSRLSAAFENSRSYRIRSRAAIVSAYRSRSASSSSSASSTRAIGRTHPPSRQHGHVLRKLLDEMCELIVRDAPDLVLLQEVPVWAGALLRERTGMGVPLAPAYGAHIPFLHVPLPLALGATVGRALPDLVRTQVEGQANAVLYGA